MDFDDSFEDDFSSDDENNHELNDTPVGELPEEVRKIVDDFVQNNEQLQDDFIDQESSSVDSSESPSDEYFSVSQSQDTFSIPKELIISHEQNSPKEEVFAAENKETNKKRQVLDHDDEISLEKQENNEILPNLFTHDININPDSNSSKGLLSINNSNNDNEHFEDNNSIFSNEITKNDDNSLKQSLLSSLLKNTHSNEETNNHSDEKRTQENDELVNGPEMFITDFNNTDRYQTLDDDNKNEFNKEPNYEERTQNKENADDFYDYEKGHYEEQKPLTPHRKQLLSDSPKIHVPNSNHNRPISRKTILLQKRQQEIHPPFSHEQEIQNDRGEIPNLSNSNQITNPLYLQDKEIEEEKPKLKISLPLLNQRNQKQNLSGPKPKFDHLYNSQPISPAEGSIDDFDPENPQPIQDHYSKEAMKNLSVSFADLCYPTEADLIKYTKDHEFKEIVKTKLIRRADNAIKAVKQERDRLLRKKQQIMNQQIMSRSAPNELVQSRTNYAEVERQRLERLEQKRVKTAEQIILGMIIENNNAEDDSMRKEIENEMRKQREEEVKKKQQKEMQKLKKISADKERSEEEKRKKDAEMLRKQEEKHEQLMIKREQEEKERRLKFLKIEEERKKHYEEAKRKEIEENKRKEQAYHEKAQQDILREQALKDKREKKQKQIREQNLQQFALQRSRMEKIQRNKDKIIQDKRSKTEMKMRKQQEEFKKIIKEKEERREEQIRMEEEKVSQAKQKRTEKEIQKQKDRETAWRESEEKTAEILKQREKEYEKQRQEQATIEQIKLEDQRILLNRNERQRQTILRESDEAYKQKMRRLEYLEKQRQFEIQKSNLMRIKLEQEKEKIIEMSKKTSSIKGANQKKLKRISNELGVDYDALKRRADAMRRGRRYGTNSPAHSFEE